MQKISLSNDSRKNIYEYLDFSGYTLVFLSSSCYNPVGNYQP